VLPNLKKNRSSNRRSDNLLPPVSDGLGSLGRLPKANVQPSWTPGVGLPLGDPSTELGLARYKHYDVQLDWCEVCTCSHSKLA
jgi:hypothetical protein